MACSTHARTHARTTLSPPADRSRCRHAGHTLSHEKSSTRHTCSPDACFSLLMGKSRSYPMSLISNMILFALHAQSPPLGPDHAECAARAHHSRRVGVVELVRGEVPSTELHQELEEIDEMQELNAAAARQSRHKQRASGQWTHIARCPCATTATVHAVTRAVKSSNPTQ
jgi:hypothetical protein